MGQRHQIFIVVPNPARVDATLSKFLGTGKITVLAFHNQWLYGRAALESCAAVMGMDQDLLHFPAGTDFGKWIAAIEKAIQVQPLGCDQSFFLNEREPEMREHCDHGDNNDGIHVCDPIGGIYCFLDIDTDGDIGPYLQPLTAKQYVESYYATEPEKVSDYWAGEYAKEGLSRAQVAEKFALASQPKIDALEPYTLFSWVGLSSVFPKMAEQFRSANVVTAP